MLLAPGIVHAIQPPSSGAPSTPAGWQVIDSHAVVNAAGEALVDFVGLPATFAAVVLVGESLCALNDTTAAGNQVAVEANEWDGGDYLWTRHRVQSIGLGTQHLADALSNQSLEIGRVSWLPSGGVGALVAWFPGYATPGTFKEVISHASWGYGNGRGLQDTGGDMRLGLARSTVIDHLRVFIGVWSGSPSNLFVPPSRFTLYGVALP